MRPAAVATKMNRRAEAIPNSAEPRTGAISHSSEREPREYDTPISAPLFFTSQGRAARGDAPSGAALGG